MSLPRHVARNAAWSAAGMMTGLATGFIATPILIHRLGPATYALWIVIASMTSYFHLLDFGLRAAITRHVAFFRAKGDQPAVNAILSTAQAVLAASASLTVAATFGLVALFSTYGHVPARQLSEARLALLLAGITVAVTLVLSVFDAALWAYERFDVLNTIERTSEIGQAAILVYLVWRGGSLVMVASVLLAGTLCTEVAKALACFRLDPSLRIGPTRVRAWALRLLVGFGLWKLLWSIGARATSQGGPLIIWARLNADLVTPYSVAARLVAAAKGISTAGTGILTPTATALHASDQHAPQQALFVEGARYSLALSLFFASAIVLLGKPFLSLWMGPALASASTASALLALGELLPMSQWITCSLLLARDRHRVVATASFVEIFLVIGLGWTLARPLGLVGVCLAVGISATLCRGVLPIVYGCRVLAVPLRRYVRRALLPPAAALSIPATGLAALVHHRPPETWLHLFVYGAAFSLLYAAACAVFVVGPRSARTLLPSAKSLLLRMGFPRGTVTP